MITRPLDWLARFVGVAALATAGCSGDTEGTPPGPSQANPLDAEESAMVQLLNDLRSQSGSGMLKPCGTLNLSASKHSDDMRDNGYLDDDAPSGSTPRSRACEAGYQTACGTTAAMAELVASGIYYADGALGQWTKEAGTKALLLDPGLVAVGLGLADGGDSPVWTVDFGGAYEASCDTAPQ